MCLKTILLWCAFSNTSHQSGSDCMAWKLSYDLHLSSNCYIQAQYANLPRAALKFVQVMSCTRAPGWKVRGLKSHPAPLSSQDPCSGCILEVGVPFLTCIWAKGGPEILFLIPILPEIPKSSIHLLTSNTMDVFFEERGYAHGKGEFILKICFLFSEGGRKKERK